MFYEPHERLIYSPTSFPDHKYDPLAIQRAFVVATGNKFVQLLRDWQAVNEPSGDMNAGDSIAVSSAQAEGELVKATRVVFSLPPFPEVTDATVLEVLCDYQEWMSGKGTRGNSPHASSGSVPDSDDPSTTKSS